MPWAALERYAPGALAAPAPADAAAATVGATALFNFSQTQRECPSISFRFQDGSINCPKEDP